MFLDERHRGDVLSFEVRPPACHQFYLLCLQEHVLDLIVGVRTVPVQWTFRRQVVVHPLQYLRIVLGTLDKVHLHRDAVGGGDQLYLHPIEVFPFRCIVAPVYLVPKEFATAYPDVVACLHRKGVDDLTSYNLSGLPAIVATVPAIIVTQIVEALGRMPEIQVSPYK